MTMKITFRNILNRGEKTYQLVTFSGIISYDELPKEYLENTHVYRGSYNPDSIEIRNENERSNGYRTRTFFKDEIISEKEKEWILTTMTAAGKRFEIINKEIKKLKTEWEGKEETFII